MPRENPHGLSLPIDYFLRALAEDQQDRAIGIILSGTGTDGTLGLQAIKGHGGLTLVQAADDARFSGMPLSALATGAVDHVLPAAAMPQALLAFARGPYLTVPTEEDTRPDLTEDLLRQIYILLRHRTKHDFSAYRATAIRRRLARRMAVHHLDTPPQYLQLLREHPHELDLLFRELLIGVTAFFRDPEAFDCLATHALPQTSDDMKNLLNSTDIATLFLDHQLHIRRFTSQATQVIKLIGSDVGRPIGDLVSNLNYTTLERDAQDVRRTLVSKEIEIPTPEGQWYFMRMMPYRTADNVIGSLVLTFVDITLQKQAELESREALVILDAELRVVSANRAFYRMFQQTADGVVGEPFFYLSGGAWAHAERQRLLRDILDSGSIFEDFQLAHTFPDIGAKNLRLNARRVARTPGLSPLILLTIEDRTDRPYSRADTMPVMRALVPSEESCDDAT